MSMAKELAAIPIELQTYDWLSHWWKPLRKGGWHAPIILVEGKIVSQGQAINRGGLVEAVVAHYVKRAPITGSVMFGKASCPHCERAKTMLKRAKIDYLYLDVIENMRALYEMFPRVKAHIGEKTPVTVPQIWLDGDYIGGADELSQFLKPLNNDLDP